MVDVHVLSVVAAGEDSRFVMSEFRCVDRDCQGSVVGDCVHHFGVAVRGKGDESVDLDRYWGGLGVESALSHSCVGLLFVG